MKNHRIFSVSSKIDLERCYPVMRELRPHLSVEKFLEIYQKAHDGEGYILLAVENDEGAIQALMGYRFIHDFVHGYHLYVDDLVCTEKVRSQGLGAELLRKAESIAFEKGCHGLRLCTGVENERGKKFYEKNGWFLRAVAFKKKL